MAQQQSPDFLEEIKTKIDGKDYVFQQHNMFFKLFGFFRFLLS